MQFNINQATLRPKDFLKTGPAGPQNASKYLVIDQYYVTSCTLMELKLQIKVE